MRRESLAVLLSIVGMLGMAVSVVPAIFAHYRISSIYYRTTPPSPEELSGLGLLAFGADVAVAIFAMTAITGFLHMAHVKKVRILGVLLMLAGLLMLLGSPFASIALQPSTTISEGVVIIDRNSLFGGTFEPSRIRVLLGINSTVTWTVDRNSIHPDVIASDTAVFNSGLIAQGSSWSYTFRSPGLYGYHSVIHPWMTGMVEVVQV